MDTYSSIIAGFSESLQLSRLFYCLLGSFLGTIVGVIPGLGPSATIALLLPITFHMDTVSAIIMLAGIYYGAQYGGSTTSIMVNVPGESSSVVTCLDGYAMARQGRAGPALGMAAFSSFIAGTFGVVVLMIVAIPLGEFALKFGPPEYFTLMLLGLTLVCYLGEKSFLKSMLMVCMGLFLGTVGLDALSGAERFTYGALVLQDGVGLVPVFMGMFGIAEVLSMIEKPLEQQVIAKPKGLFPTKKDWKDSGGAIARGSVIGFFLGVLPGGGCTLASIAAYVTEKKFSKHPEKFGKGAIEGVAAPEAANNSAASGSFIPLLTLGIPANVVTAMLLAALMLHGVVPGPMMINEHPDLFWGVVTSMYVGNLMLLLLNLPLIGLFTTFLRTPYPILAPIILVTCLIGAYSTNFSTGDVFIMTAAGGLGYLFRRMEFDVAPLVLALVLGPQIEVALRQSLNINRGNILVFFQRPISLVFMGVIILSILSPFIKTIYRKISNRRKSK
ncbi:MAG: tripartite tricarboxylate transporter permease [Deltaproteobacteria bacterium]|nr:tripartite tricarboxylate transporter permease [Deltaproteobacteria bacterium]